MKFFGFAMPLVFLLLSGILSAQVFTYYIGQSGISFTQSTSSIMYNVTAVAQSDSYSYGPVYFIQGLTDKGYWYQEGLGYDWYGSGKFTFLYDVFAPNGAMIYNNSGYGKVIGTVNPNDKVLLALYLGTDNKVYFYVYDYDTGANSLFNYTGNGATQFVGTPTSISNQNTFFTGIMTEWPYVIPTSPYQAVTYSPYLTYNSPPYLSYNSPARLWIRTLKVIVPQNHGYSFSVIKNFTSPIVQSSAQSIFSLGNQSVLYYKGVFSTGATHLSPLVLLQSTTANLTSDFGENCSLNASASVDGGKFPYSYTVYINGLSAGNLVSNSSSESLHINCKGLPVGTDHYYVKITDSNKNTTLTPSGVLKINPATFLNSYSAIPQNSFFYNNDTEKVSIALSGGTPPYEYYWYLQNSLALSTNSPNASIHLNNGQNRLVLIVQDAAGFNLTKTSYAYTDYNYLHILLVIIIVLIILVLLLIRWYLYNRDEYYSIDPDWRAENDDTGIITRLKKRLFTRQESYEEQNTKRVEESNSEDGSTSNDDSPFKGTSNSEERSDSEKNQDLISDSDWKDKGDEQTESQDLVSDSEGSGTVQDNQSKEQKSSSRPIEPAYPYGYSANSFSNSQETNSDQKEEYVESESNGAGISGSQEVSFTEKEQVENESVSQSENRNKSPENFQVIGKSEDEISKNDIAIDSASEKPNEQNNDFNLKLNSEIKSDSEDNNLEGLGSRSKKTGKTFTTRRRSKTTKGSKAGDSAN